MISVVDNSVTKGAPPNVQDSHKDTRFQLRRRLRPKSREPSARFWLPHVPPEHDDCDHRPRTIANP
jgi:hypothetical protein